MSHIEILIRERDRIRDEKLPKERLRAEKCRDKIASFGGHVGTRYALNKVASLEKMMAALDWAITILQIPRS